MNTIQKDALNTKHHKNVDDETMMVIQRQFH